MRLRITFYVGVNDNGFGGTWFPHEQEIEIPNVPQNEISSTELLDNFDLQGEYTFIGILHYEILSDDEQQIV